MEDLLKCNTVYSAHFLDHNTNALLLRKLVEIVNRNVSLKSLWNSLQIFYKHFSFDFWYVYYTKIGHKTFV